MISKWRVEEFQEAYINRLSAMDKSIHNLVDFFSNNKHRMPNFLERHYEILSYQADDFNILVDRPIVKAPVYYLFGTSWVFQSNEMKPENPELLAHYFLHGNPDVLPAITAKKINNTKYLLQDGSHQLYTAYLQKWPYVLVEVEGEYVSDENE